jgi:hypothetical protein
VIEHTSNAEPLMTVTCMKRARLGRGGLWIPVPSGRFERVQVTTLGRTQQASLVGGAGREGTGDSLAPLDLEEVLARIRSGLARPKVP